MGILDKPPIPKDVDGNRLDHMHVEARLAAAEANDALLGIYSMAGVELAYAEVAHGGPTTFPVSPASPAAIAGAVITVPPIAGPFELIYSAEGRVVTTAGGGLYRLDLRETSAPNTSIDWASAPITADYATAALSSGYNIPMKGSKRMPPSAVAKTYFLTCLLYRDAGSSLISVVQNTTDMPTIIRAVGR